MAHSSLNPLYILGREGFVQGHFGKALEKGEMA